MANTLLTLDEITTEALAVLHEHLPFIGTIDRQYDSAFVQTPGKIGESLRIRLPAEYEVTTGRSLVLQDTTQRQVTLTLATQKHVGIQFTGIERKLSLEEYSKEHLEPAMSVLASAMEADALTMALDIPSLVGTPGTTPVTLKVWLDAVAKLNQQLAPKGDKRCIQMDALTQASMVDFLKGQFNDQNEIGKQYLEGMMGKALGCKWYENNLIPNITIGTQDSTTPLINGASQSGATLAIDGLDSGATIKKGTVFTIASVNAIHQETKASYGYLKQFVVTADTTAVGTAMAALPISPSIYTDGGLQNVDAGPADDAAIIHETFAGVANATNPNNLMYHKNAFAFVMADLPLYGGADKCVMVKKDNLSMRCWSEGLIGSDVLATRIDVLYGFKTIRPELAVRIIG